jgi:magnesium-transporting ATPase (P-type)
MGALQEGLRSNYSEGLTPVDFAEREAAFGSNKKPKAKKVSFFSLFFGALDDFMLKLLLVCACISISIDVGFANPDERGTGKFTALTPCSLD